MTTSWHTITLTLSRDKAERTIRQAERSLDDGDGRVAALYRSHNAGMELAEVRRNTAFSPELRRRASFRAATLDV
jgi:hypothetical protein